MEHANSPTPTVARNDSFIDPPPFSSRGCETILPRICGIVDMRDRWVDPANLVHGDGGVWRIMELSPLHAVAPAANSLSPGEERRTMCAIKMWMLEVFRR